MKKKLLSAVLVLVLFLAMIPVSAGAAATVTEIEIVDQYATIYSTDYMSPDIELNIGDFQYRVTYSDGRVQIEDYWESLLEFSQFSVHYAGEYVSYDYPTVLQSGKQAVEIQYLGNTYRSYITITGVHEEFGYAYAVSADQDMTFSEYEGREAWGFWRLNMSTSGIYSLYSNYAFANMMEYWSVQIFDKYNNEVPAVDDMCEWQLVAGEDYYLSLRCTFLDSYYGELLFCLSRTGAMTGSNRFATPLITELTNTLNGVSVKWNPVAGAAKYRVFYKTPTGSWTKAGDTTSTNLTVTGLASGINYTFTVRCIDASGSFTSSLDPIGKSITYLMAPKLTYIGTSVKGVELKWNAVKGAENYGVWYKTATGAWTKAGNTTDTQYVVSGLTSGTTYTFTVRCLSADGKSYMSGFDSVGKTFTYLETPKLSYIGTSVKGVEVKWNAVKNAENYGVWYKTATGSWTKAGNTTGTEMVVTGLTSGTTYTFTVRCLSADGKTYMSGFDAVGKTFTYLETPKLSYIGTSVKGVEVKWNAVKNAENYGVWYKTATGSWTKAGTTTGTEMVVSGLTSGTTYTFTVRCLSADGKTYMSGFDSVGKTFTY
ncbi:MAG: fibronectin type III domain-containing protein, partial [Oscillospiraceae bacterium]|nr:fibronectin type III domain-containing protein [Oscillospiraceae bacterium]